MADCNAPSAISNIASKDTNRLVGKIAAALAANAPFINVLGGGTFPSGLSDEVRSVVQMPANPGDSLVAPAFINDTEMCGVKGNETQTSTIEFTYRLKSLRGTGPRICVKKGFSAFKDSYSKAEDALKKYIVQLINADVKSQLLTQSATKFVAAPGQPFSALLTGGTEADMGVGFVDIEPSGQLTFKALHRIARHVREVLLADTFEGGNARFIGSSDIIEAFREETGVKEVLLSLASGGYKMGETVLTSYQWESGAPYRGIQFGVDQRPFRATSINVNGTLNLVNPYEAVVDGANNKSYAKISNAWLTAPLEVGFLVFANSFDRMVPERYVGEGSFKFAPQLVMGELDWHYHVDNDCNLHGDYGFHKYQISRAYRPVRPQHVIPIVYRRCEADMDLAACPVA